ncbi:MAG: hypothetical protein Q8Q73_00620 [Stagnimonas sp.]|nr:hypothetical protein [Stagnimonas sp.]
MFLSSTSAAHCRDQANERSGMTLEHHKALIVEAGLGGIGAAKR